jgi:DNA-binding Lrp family transcriptional regulator
MVYGYILIGTKNSYEHEVSDELSRLDEVVDVEPLLVEETALADPFFEDYELIAKIKAENSKDLKKIVDDKIHTIHGVEKIKVASRSKL